MPVAVDEADVADAAVVADAVAMVLDAVAMARPHFQRIRMPSMLPTMATVLLSDLAAEEPVERWLLLRLRRRLRWQRR
jgi:hypothetical protein